MKNRNDVETEAKNQLGIQAATFMLWLATSLLGIIALPRALNVAMGIYAGFWGAYGFYGSTYSTAVALRQLLILPFSIILTVVVIGGAEYHHRHVGESKSWRVFAQTLGAELAILLMAMFI